LEKTKTARGKGVERRVNRRKRERERDGGKREVKKLRL